MGGSLILPNTLSRVARIGAVWVFVMGCAALKAAEFIRGDVNSDGLVSLADTNFLNRFFFNGGPPPPCSDSADADDSGALNVADSVFVIMEYLVLGSSPPAFPYPEAGEDPTDDDLDCATYGDGPAPVSSPTDTLMILDAVADPSTASFAVITIGVSSGATVGGFAGRIRAPAGVLADASSEETSVPRIGIETLLEIRPGHRASVLMARVASGTLSFGYLSAVAEYVGIQPGEAKRALEIQVPLDPSVSTGDHPLTFEAGEIVPLEPTLPSILPRLTGSTLRVTAAPRFLRGDCNDDGTINIADSQYLLNFLFLAGPKPACEEATDVNDDRQANIADAQYLLSFLFLGGPKPDAPYPDCGPGPEGETLGCESSACQ